MPLNPHRSEDDKSWRLINPWGQSDPRGQTQVIRHVVIRDADMELSTDGVALSWKLNSRVRLRIANL